MRLLILAILTAALPGCVKQRAVETSLVGAGVRGPVAECMSNEMAKRLSVAQLRKLSRAAPRAGEATEPRTPADYLARARRVGDAEAVVVTGAAAAYCSAVR